MSLGKDKNKETKKAIPFENPSFPALDYSGSSLSFKESN